MDGDDGLRHSEVLLQHDVHATQQLCHQEVVTCPIEGGILVVIPSLGCWKPEAGWRWAGGDCLTLDCRGERCAAANRDEVAATAGRPK